MKLKFWIEALSVIADKFGGDNTYSNVSPVVRSTVDGFVGIVGQAMMGMNWVV